MEKRKRKQAGGVQVIIQYSISLVAMMYLWFALHSVLWLVFAAVAVWGIIDGIRRVAAKRRGISNPAGQVQPQNEGDGIR